MSGNGGPLSVAKNSVVKFLANQNIPRQSIQLLRQYEYEVYSISESALGVSDIKVIEIAQKSNLIILTFDKDYGDIIFKKGNPNPPAVIFFRDKGLNPMFAGKILLSIIAAGIIEFQNHFTVVEKDSIRQRKY